MNRKLVTKNFKIIERVYKLCEKSLTSSSTSKNMIGSGYPDVEIPKLTLPEFFEPYFDKFERFTAIECSETKKKYTYGEIKKKSDNIAKALRKIFKLKDGDIVALVLPNVPEYTIANLGILKANLVITTVSPAYTSDEISKQLKDSDAKVVITDHDNLKKVSDGIRNVSKMLPVLMIKTKNGQDLPNGTIDFHELMNAEIDYPNVKPWSPDNLAILPYSSGTTGLPKGVQLTHKNLVSHVSQIYQPDVRFLYDASETYQEVLPTILPFYHAYGYNVAINGSVLCGAKIVTLRKFTPDSYTKMLKEYEQSTAIFAAPPLVLMLTNNGNVKKDYLKNLRLLVSGAAPLSESDEQRFFHKFGDHITVAQGYGMTETTAISTFCYPNVIKGKDSSKGSVGIPSLNSTMKVLSINDPERAPLGPLETGEIYIKGPQVMKGYFNRPEETKECLSDDGWLKTGDIGHYNEDGFFFITDRIKELIKVKAYQVPPAELEGIIRTFPGVSEAAVIGIPHPSNGEAPRAYVVPKKGMTVNAEKLNEFVSEKVAKYKKLVGGVVIVDEIPKSAAGKILRRQLKEEFLKSCR